jgi:hypothetical protein
VADNVLQQAIDAEHVTPAAATTGVAVQEGFQPAEAVPLQYALVDAPAPAAELEELSQEMVHIWCSLHWGIAC